MRLRDKVVIVTGAAGELGRTFLVALAKEEAKIMVTVAPLDKTTRMIAKFYRP
jgi:NAD(P)-dependent dehydrogenase (short-subunit alcohol dehydrogenase family)